MLLNVAKKNLNMRRTFEGPSLRRMADVLMGIVEILERIQLVNQLALRIQKHDIHRKLPVARQYSGKRIALGGEPIRIVNNDPRRDKRFVDFTHN